MNNFENDNIFSGNGNEAELNSGAPQAEETHIVEEIQLSNEATEEVADDNAPNRIYGTISPLQEEAYESGNPAYSESEFASSETESAGTSAAYEENSQYSDSYYMNKSPYGPRYDESFCKPKSSGKKKKKYISVPAAAVALVLTAAISIAGGAALSNTKLFGGKSGFSQNGSASLNDNINNSVHTPESIPGTTAIANQSGQPLTTPEIVDKVGPAVVGIINKTTFGNAYGQFGRFYGDLEDEIEQSSGSGVIISSDGYIVTNNHVVENATKLTVILNNGDEYEAKAVGRDSSTDLALIKIEASNLTYAQMGTSSNLRVGEKAIAIGNPLGQEFAGTTTQGIISGLNRSVTIGDKTLNLIQTDAAINPGNSGGALVNEYGVLIGINTAKISSDTLEGLGFAIPIDEAKPIIQELMTNGYVTGRPVVGIAGRAVTKEDAQAYGLKIGVYVSSMTANGPAYMSGMKVGDIIVECEGQAIETVDDINEIKNKKSPGDELKFKVWRKSDYKELIVILGEEMPAE